MSKYLFLAPFNGYVVDTYAEPGSTINPGVRIARIANIESMEVKLPIAIDLYEKFKEKGSVQFLNADNEPIGSGKIIGHQMRLIKVHNPLMSIIQLNP